MPQATGSSGVVKNPSKNSRGESFSASDRNYLSDDLETSYADGASASKTCETTAYETGAESNIERSESVLGERDFVRQNANSVSSHPHKAKRPVYLVGGGPTSHSSGRNSSNHSGNAGAPGGGNYNAGANGKENTSVSASPASNFPEVNSVLKEHPYVPKERLKILHSKRRKKSSAVSSNGATPLTVSEDSNMA